MKNFLSKEHYCYKSIYTLLLKSSAYLLSIGNPLYGLPPPFLQENLDPPPYDFSEIPTLP